ncbi:MAG: RecX family transcriptional regulator [Treponema sp.]|nr:RecX family transcriptional regulator [Candidatus Treponema caballi]
MSQTIGTAEYIGSDCVKCTFSDGSAFYVRLAYLQLCPPEKVTAASELSEEEFADLVDAALVYAAERDAVAYLERSEHSRFLLKTKLIKKKHSAADIERALDYCEERNWLSDSRFAGAWLRSRAITHTEGRIRLQGELAARGVSRQIAQEALNEFFEAESEEDRCLRAREKLIAQGKEGDALIRSLVRKGFSEKIIRKCEKNE